MFAYILGFLAFLAMNGFLSACYIGNSGTFPKPLNAEEEELYIERYKNGDIEAKNILIERNLRLVAHVVKKFTSQGCKDSDDLMSIGTIGLIKGVTSYKQHKGTRLATYAAKCIENEILMYIRSQKKLQSEVLFSDPVGMDREGNEITFMDIVGEDSEQVFEEVALKMQIKKLYCKMLEALHKRERTILMWRYGLKNQDVKTQNEIASELGISRSYVYKPAYYKWMESRATIHFFYY